MHTMPGNIRRLHLPAKLSRAGLGCSRHLGLAWPEKLTIEQGTAQLSQKRLNLAASTGPIAATVCP